MAIEKASSKDKRTTLVMIQKIVDVQRRPSRPLLKVARRCLACRAQRGPLGVLPKAKYRIYFGLNMKQIIKSESRENRREIFEEKI